MTIHIEALTFDVIIGLLDFERDKPQKVIIDLKASYAYTENEFIDYADMVLLIQNELKEKRYTLLEDALLGVKKCHHHHLSTTQITLFKDRQA